ncbi:hypothetical protein N7492_008848 [Penicillium capsulatum]|uniref:Uncharacterized protein n=1 Tax=Penicillium capsulatum TaxID=69766 RepID=A0A9W9HTU2_9EURO|nr:hypothetical protein N7492_008848 [Penicillium capsulatum]KAJ6106250.1 hypothetical protein N7512_009767 [Penicillium capsulatum]
MANPALFWLLLCLSGLVASQTCYWPSGEKAAEDWLQCPNSKHCCHETEACLSNGLCFGGKHMTLYRGACTDQSWNTGDCPKVCFEKIASKWANLFRCSSNESIFNCGTQGRNHVCANKLGSYKWVSANVSEAMIMRSSSGSSPSASASACPSDTSAKDSAAKDSSPRDIGVGLGVGLGVPFLLAIGGMAWYYTHTRRQIQALQQQLVEQRVIADEKGSRLPGTPGSFPRELENPGPRPPELNPDSRSELPS